MVARTKCSSTAPMPNPTHSRTATSFALLQVRNAGSHKLLWQMTASHRLSAMKWRSGNIDRRMLLASIKTLQLKWNNYSTHSASDSFLPLRFFAPSPSRSWEANGSDIKETSIMRGGGGYFKAAHKSGEWKERTGSGMAIVPFQYKDDAGADGTK